MRGSEVIFDGDGPSTKKEIDLNVKLNEIRRGATKKMDKNVDESVFDEDLDRVETEL